MRRSDGPPHPVAHSDGRGAAPPSLSVVCRTACALAPAIHAPHQIRDRSRDDRPGTSAAAERRPISIHGSSVIAIACGITRQRLSRSHTMDCIASASGQRRPPSMPRLSCSSSGTAVGRISPSATSGSSSFQVSQTCLSATHPISAAWSLGPCEQHHACGHTLEIEMCLIRIDFRAYVAESVMLPELPENTFLFATMPNHNQAPVIVDFLAVYFVDASVFSQLTSIFEGMAVRVYGELPAC